MAKSLLSISEFCELYGVSRSVFYRMLNAGDIRAVKIGRVTRIRPADAEAWARRLAPYKPAA